jgi:DNA repair protein RadA/Sms
VAKTKTLYVCSSCAWETAKWVGKCGGCGEWNTMAEELRMPDSGSGSGNTARTTSSPLRLAEPVKLGDVSQMEEQRLKSKISELDRVLGGGFVPGSVVLLGGDPGIGKSTLSMQIAGIFASRGLDVLYVSGEESLGQLKLRAQRLGIDASGVSVLLETSLERVDQLMRDRKPGIAIIDSIQTLGTEKLTSSPGSVTQLREVTGALTQLAKGLGIPTILIGHVTKDGNIAGPKVLEHMVDTVLYFEGEQGLSYRVLRAVKNRYGSTNEIGVFEMRGDGLHEVSNPSAMFLQERPQGASGSVVVPVVEGTRPLLVEIQALSSPPGYGPPRVNAIGVDSNRVILLLHIIDKRMGLKVTGHDVFVNVAGGARVMETAADLGMAAAVLSSYLDRAIPSDMLVFGEMGLAGEVRAVGQAPARLMEAHKLGFRKVVLPRGNQQGVDEMLKERTGKELRDLSLVYVRTVADAIRAIFGEEVSRPQQQQQQQSQRKG